MQFVIKKMKTENLSHVNYNLCDISMNELIMDLSVTNDDTAERAVKKVTDYANSAPDGGQRGKIIGVAARHHSKMSGYTKEDLENAI